MGASLLFSQAILALMLSRDCVIVRVAVPVFFKVLTNLSNYGEIGYHNKISHLIDKL